MSAGKSPPSLALGLDAIRLALVQALQLLVLPVPGEVDAGAAKAEDYQDEARADERELSF